MSEEAKAPATAEGGEEGNTRNALSARELEWAKNSPELLAAHKATNGS